MKKAFVFNISLVFITTIVLMSIFLVLQSKRSSLELDNLGSRPLDLISSYESGESIRFFIEQSLRNSFGQSVFDLASNGGFVEYSKCGSYLGYQLWQPECFPNLDSEFNKRLQLVFGDFLLTYKQELPLSYSSAIESKDPLKVSAFPNTPITIDVFTKKLTSVKPGFWAKLVAKISGATLPEPSDLSKAPKFVSKNSKGVMNNIYILYSSSLSRYTIDYPQVSKSLIAGVIAQESKGDPFAIGTLGTSAGLTQFELATAKGFPQVFKKLTDCACSGSKCKLSALCNPSNDDRLNPDISIKGSFVYYASLLNSFSKFSSATEFAVASYNGGESVIRKAISSTGLSNPSWPQVSAALRPELITYISSESARLRKVEIIRNYVKAVMAYKSEYELLDQAQKQQAYEEKKKDLAKTHDCCFCSQKCGFDCSLVPVPESQACGPLSIGIGVNCDVSSCSLPQTSTSTYQFRPVVAASSNYNLTTYQRIQYLLTSNNGLLANLATCSSAKPLAVCLAPLSSVMSEKDPSLKWGFDLDCDSNAEMVFDRFAENLLLCSMSATDNCVCNLAMDIGKQMVPDGTFEIKLSNSGSTTVLQSDKVKDFTVPVLSSIFLRSMTSSEKADFKYDINYRKGVFYKASLNTANYVSVLGKNVRIVKQGKALTFVDDEVFAASFASMPSCTVQKDTLRVCVSRLISGKPEQVYAFNPLTGKVEPRNLVYRFAIKASV
ncbi:MAG: transglycosylase SLT domain-containing protein [Candidatus Woesearchaeota archaeon]